MLEIFDFDVFESISENPSAWNDFLTLPKNSKEGFFPNEENTDFPTILSTKSSTLQNFHSTDFYHLHGGLPETASEKEEFKQFQQIQEPRELTITQPSESPFMEAINVTLLRQMNGGEEEENKDPVDKILFAHLTASGRKEDSEGSKQHSGNVAVGDNEGISTMVLSTETSSIPVTSMEVCPHDVLYVSDLFAFSSRFCGTNSPLNKNMTFGSSLKMVEVIVELITTTDRGRGFAMLFEYKNDTELIAMNDSKDGKENIMMLVIITGILFFALVLLSSLCIACRRKSTQQNCVPLDFKAEASATIPGSEPELITYEPVAGLSHHNKSADVHCPVAPAAGNGIQNAAADINELRLVMPSQENENNNHSVGGNGIVTSCNGSMECIPPQTDPDLPSSISALTAESGSDEVFIISASPGAGGLSFTSYQIQDKKLKRSITSPGSVSDWIRADQTEPGLSVTERRVVQTETHCPAQQTWSTYAFHDLLAPLPQLQKKWCSWTTNSPFTKLVNSGGISTSMKSQTTVTRKVTSSAEIDGNSGQVYSDSSASTASYPLTHSAQKECKLSSSCTLKRSRFGNPSLSLLTSSPSCNPPRLPDHSVHAGARSLVNISSQGAKITPAGSIQLKSNATSGSDSKELSLEMDKPKPVFVISEEGDDQQPLVLAEHMNQCVDSHAKPNVVIHNLQMAVVSEQAVDLTLQGESFAESTSIRTDLGFWREYPNSYKDSLNGCGAYKDQSYVPVSDTGTTTISTHQTYDSLASHRLWQTSVQ
ncbi:hypothetical protein JD844_015099 [Phrynosoma platyrhinos]|uniref:Uncharacterized protein n=1 Tax=Phrynosoma platyrhinos TaxID=52577 RepID=A0ABQ7T758_PHRPL|nr:hypothetical protein JD844_015099 [Phrynosoma platyrhinos]